jgi:plastocyanin
MHLKSQAGLLALVFLAACGGGGSSYSPTSPVSTGGGNSGTNSTPGTNEIIATSGNAFNPASLTVAKGTTVTFTFQAVEHNVTFANVTGAPANIGNTASTSVTRVFATAGTFGYQCTIHSGMQGTVTVN